MKQEIESCQLLIAIADSWDACVGDLYLYERDSLEEKWRLSSEKIAVAFGKNGLAWGEGILPTPCEKREGDEKSPAGLFSLPSAFGFSETLQESMQISYIHIQEDVEAIDDPQSKYYNQIVRRKEIPFPDWKSSEKMREISVYENGLVIGHNTQDKIPGKGSAIFMHIWEKENNPTPGCTVMSRENMRKILQFVSQKKTPLLLQIPKEEYINLQNSYVLPDIE